MSTKQTSEKVGGLPAELVPDIESMRRSGWHALPPDKRAFAIAYASCNSHVEAAREIGKAGQGLKYINDPLVRALIADIHEEHAKISIINKHLVEMKMLETLEKLEGREAVPMVTGQGIPILERKFHPGETVSLIREMGKVAGIVPEKDERRDKGVVININMEALLGSGHGVTIDSTSE